MPQPSCALCGRTEPAVSIVPAASIRPGIAARLDRLHPGWRTGGFVCADDLARVRAHRLADLLRRTRGAAPDAPLPASDHAVVESLAEGSVIAQDVAGRADAAETVGERAADRLASFGGSWTFILLFAGVIAVWMAVNASALLFRPFDPYPFILLNLVLSCVASMQAPVIMMSQRRQDERDRAQAENDYRVNLKAELEIRELRERIDHIAVQQAEGFATLRKALDARAPDRG